ncbi:hypothetical protein [Duganella aceris]|jgi:hypothetical protein|uniref:Uncharacterized protein n=1 Tax=Duganella aceris TaxID=2703883 RepID=A0ABX0FHN6_9BURK|nr:hypothetical protein [Duganella aceris]NGZ84007.1 hypothetical protein [Duganella aceris]
MKNPFMSAFLSAANRVAGTARAQATAAVKREAAKNTRQWTDAWVNAMTLTPKRKRKRAGK